MTEFFDNTEFVSQLGYNVQKSRSMTATFLAFGIGIAAGVLLHSLYLKGIQEITLKKHYDRNQLKD